MRDHYGVLVTDIGAFTTDFGYVKFDSSFKSKEWNAPPIVQKSYTLGIRELDAAVVTILSAEAQEYIQNTSADDWDAIKRELYSGKAQKLTRKGFRAIVVGEGDEREAIQSEIRRFAERVCAARAEFCLRADAGAVDEEALTGGGSNIRSLRVAFLERVAFDGRIVHDLLDPDEPKKATEAGAGKMTSRQAEQRVNENHSLVRGGSAIGGASVFFEQY
jgi:hypothetical protein